MITEKRGEQILPGSPIRNFTSFVGLQFAVRILLLEGQRVRFSTHFPTLLGYLSPLMVMDDDQKNDLALPMPTTTSHLNDTLSCRG